MSVNFDTRNIACGDVGFLSPQTPNGSILDLVNYISWPVSCRNTTQGCPMNICIAFKEKQDKQDKV